MSLQVTSLDTLREIAKGEVVELPGFSSTPFVARLRQASLVSLVASGKIPNKLLGLATTLFNSDTEKLNKHIEKKDGVTDMYEIMKIMANACLVEPTLKDIEEAGLELSDIQLTAIFNYSQRGLDGLAPFLKK